MKFFQNFYLFVAVIVGFVSALGLMKQFTPFNLAGFFFYTTILVTFYVSNKLLWNRKKYSFALCFGILNLVWWPLLWQTIRRIQFVIENGGMEGANGYGSPLAFIIGVVFEQMMFLPTTIAIIAGLFLIARSNKRMQHTAESGR